MNDEPLNLPWKADYTDVLDVNGSTVASCLSSRMVGYRRAVGRAAFIIRACNAHASLVASCKEMLKKLAAQNCYTLAAYMESAVGTRAAAALALANEPLEAAGPADKVQP